MVQFDLLPSPAWQPLGQVQLFGTGGGELFEVVLFLGVGGEANNFSLFCKVHVISCAVCMLAADLKATYF